MSTMKSEMENAVDSTIAFVDRNSDMLLQVLLGVVTTGLGVAFGYFAGRSEGVSVTNVYISPELDEVMKEANANPQTVEMTLTPKKGK
jgi:hypothetical protein